MDAGWTGRVAICAATGTQGLEVAKRVLAAGGSETFVRALTRNAAGAGAVPLRAIERVDVVQVDYGSGDSLKAAFKGCDAVFINCELMEDEADVYTRVVDAAVATKVERLIFSSTIACDGDHNVPHWKTSFQTEQYIREKHADAVSQGSDFQYYFLRLGHVNENAFSYFPPKRGQIDYPWGVDIPVHTCSTKDLARAAAVLLLGRCTAFPSGACIDAVTEKFTPRELATAISVASGCPISAAKGPWVFLTFGHHFGWVPNSILTMAEYLERRGGSEANLEHLPALLGGELEAEPLERIKEFAERRFKGDTSIGPSTWCCSRGSPPVSHAAPEVLEGAGRDEMLGSYPAGQAVDV